LGKKIKTVPADIIAILQAHTWPGNVRELENVVERAMILATGDKLQFPASMLAVRHRKEAKTSILRTLDEVEINHIQAVLNHTDGVIAGPSGAAKILGMNPNTLRSRMEKLGITTER
jgi:DNA-binding NtrC family response regulator